MYVFRELTDFSYPAIAREFGGRDHTTVIHAVEKITGLMKERRQIYDQVTELIAPDQERWLTWSRRPGCTPSRWTTVCRHHCGFRGDTAIDLSTGPSATPRHCACGILGTSRRTAAPL